MKSIYNVHQEYRNIVDEIVENGGEVTESLEQALSTTKQELEVAASQFSLLTREMDNQALSIQAEIERLQDYKKHIEGTSAKIKEQIKNAMLAAEIQKIKGELVSISFRKSEATVIDDETLIPLIYKDQKTVYNINKTDIKNAIKSGVNVPGARIVENKNINIK